MARWRWPRRPCSSGTYPIRWRHVRDGRTHADVKVDDEGEFSVNTWFVFFWSFSSFLCKGLIVTTSMFHSLVIVTPTCITFCVNLNVSLVCIQERSYAHPCSLHMQYIYTYVTIVLASGIEKGIFTSTESTLDAFTSNCEHLYSYTCTACIIPTQSVHTCTSGHSDL